MLYLFCASKLLRFFVVLINLFCISLNISIFLDFPKYVVINLSQEKKKKRKDNVEGHFFFSEIKSLSRKCSMFFTQIFYKIRPRIFKFSI